MDNLTQTIEECIDLELNVAALYILFHFAIPEDEKFWWQLHKEERNHADLLCSLKDTFLPADVYPEALALPSLDELKKTNSYLTSLLEKYRKEPPERKEALLVALEIEYSAGEVHFQDFSIKPTQEKIDKVFQSLIQDDKNHAKRIQKYMQDIELQTS